MPSIQRCGKRSQCQLLGGLWTHRINIALILHYPQPPALSHVVGNPLAADYCNPTECLDDTSDHDTQKKGKKKKQSPAACSRCTSSKNKGIKLRYDLTHCLLLLKASAAVPEPFPGPVDSPDRHWQRLGITAPQSVGDRKSFNLLVTDVSPLFSLPLARLSSSPARLGRSVCGAKRCCSEPLTH